MSKLSNTGRAPGPVHGLDRVRPLNARSLALSALLGSHPPRLPARALVALAELFGIAPGTMRTALSRLVANGDLVADDGAYHLDGALLERQRSQDRSRTAPTTEWDGTWHTVVAADDQRNLADRRSFRAMMHNYRFGELRPHLWMRPANEPAPPADADLIITTGPLSGRQPRQLVADLWNLDEFDRAGRSLLAESESLIETLDWSDHKSIPVAFTTAAAVVRYLRAQPRLPSELTPSGWPVERLRTTYDDLEHRHRPLLRAFLRRSSD